MKKVAILGGGVAGLSAAWQLSKLPNFASDYEVHVHQMSFRSAGKAVAWRAGPEQVIEEHGLHQWFGFYENAFTMLREVYDQLGLDFDEAFAPTNHITWTHEWQGSWVPWCVEMPATPGQPGDGDDPDSFDVVISRLGDAIINLIRNGADIFNDRADQLDTDGLPLTPGDTDEDDGYGGVGWLIAPLGLLLRQVDRFDTDIPLLDILADGVREATAEALKILLNVIEFLLSGLIQTDLRAYRLWISLEFFIVNLAGMLDDDVFALGFEVINEEDYFAWLNRHRPGIQWNCLIQSAYDSSFAIRGDEEGAPYDIEAGTVLRGGLQMFLLYKGAVVWRPRGAMAERVVIPLYHALKARGVHFHFFHKVTSMELDPAQPTHIGRVSIDVQAEAISGSLDDYDPTIKPPAGSKVLEHWPEEPKPTVDPVAGNLEDENNNRRKAEIILERGIDFDEVICAIPLPELQRKVGLALNSDGAWQRMMENIKSCRTMAAQLWMNRPISAPAGDPALGWSCGQGDGPGPSTVLSTYGRDFNTWSDLTLLEAVEDGPAGVASIAYFCGVVEDPSGTASQATAEASLAALKDAKMKPLWPDAYPDGTFDEELILRTYVVGHTNHWNRYILSVTGSTKFRLRSECPQFPNLFLAGDWTRNGINAGCMEAAIMSGMQAARALSGADIHVWGEVGEF